MTDAMSQGVRPMENDKPLSTARVSRSVLRILNAAFRGYRRYVLALALLAVVSATLDGLSINAIIPLVSLVLAGSSPPTDAISHLMAEFFALAHVPFTFRYLLGLIGLLFLARSGALTVFTYVRGWVNAHFMAREVDALFRTTMHASWPYILRQKAGNLQNTIFWDARRETQLLDGIVQFSQSSSGAIIYLMVAVNIAPLITLVTFATGVVVLLVFRPLLRRTRGYAERVAVTEKLLAHHVSESIQGFKQVKAFGAGDYIAQKGGEYISRLEHALAKAFFVQSVGSVFIQPLAFVFVVGIFAFDYFVGTFNIATFAATVYLIQKIFTYIDSTQSSFHMILQFVPFAENIASFKREASAHHERASAGMKPFVFEHSLSFKDVTFTYEGKGTALSNVSFEIRKGSFVGIVGPSGSGKTTLADLILRLFKATSGSILFDGVPVDDVRIDEWRHAIGYVSQDAFILNASVSDNVRFFDPSVSREDIESATRQAQVYDEVMRLPQGFDTVLGDRGVTLSGGQRQRIALARALARHPQVLVLDEVTSSLDSELEREIQRMIAELRNELTLIVVAHRISTVVNADLMLVMEGGRVIEQGPPSKMLEDPTSYLSRMRELQRGNM